MRKHTKGEQRGVCRVYMWMGLECGVVAAHRLLMGGSDRT